MASDMATGAGPSSAEELLARLCEESVPATREAVQPPLDTGGLVNAAWTRLAGSKKLDWPRRAEGFLKICRERRRELVSQARAREDHRSRDEDGGGPPDVTDAPLDRRVLLVDRMTTRLETEDGECSRLITLRFFGGLDNREIAAIDGVSEQAVERNWSYAKARLYHMIRGEAGA